MCDSTEEAKQLSWGQGGERHKVATLEGTLFAKAGTITGGMAGNLLGRSQRWGDKEYETLKKVSCPSRCTVYFYFFVWLLVGAERPILAAHEMKGTFFCCS